MSSDCCCCSNKENAKINCPVCGNKSESVSINTVKSLVENQSDIVGEDFYLCMDEGCDVAYFNADCQISKDQVKVSIWFKKDASPKILCYCSNVTDKDIEKAVKELGKDDFKKILSHVGANDSCDCELNNPTGKCCYNTIKQYIASL